MSSLDSQWLVILLMVNKKYDYCCDFFARTTLPYYMHIFDDISKFNELLDYFFFMPGLEVTDQTYSNRDWRSILLYLLLCMRLCNDFT